MPGLHAMSVAVYIYALDEPEVRKVLDTPGDMVEMIEIYEGHVEVRAFSTPEEAHGWVDTYSIMDDDELPDEMKAYFSDELPDS